MKPTWMLLVMANEQGKAHSENQGFRPRVVVWRFAVSECVGERSLERDGATGETPMQR